VPVLQSQVLRVRARGGRASLVDVLDTCSEEGWGWALEAGELRIASHEAFWRTEVLRIQRR
jgi:hypothetical protein